MNLPRTLLFLALAGISNASLAADAESSPPAPAVFATNAAQDGMTEVAAGKVALSKSQDPAIRSFAQRMVTDHGKANAELAAIAKGKGIAVPDKLDGEHQAMLDALKAKSGKDFDHTYADHMNADHTKAIALFESATNSSDKDFAQFAEKTLPTLKEHKKLAANLPGQ